MAEPLRCPQGHHWDASVAGDDIDGSATSLCPFCGTPAQTLIVGGPAPSDPSNLGTGIYVPGGTPRKEPNLSAVPRDPTIDRGRFTKLRLYARGGLGKVSLARDEDFGRTVALKEIRSRYAEDEHCRQRFVNEAEITGQLEHPGIVPVYSLGRDPQNRPFYAMKFVIGRTFADAIEEYHRAPTPLAFRELLLRFVDVCQAVGYAHSKGVIHRDLKPANIMLGSYGETLVLDWGLAKKLGVVEAGAKPQVALATARFLSPADRAELPSANLTLAGTVLGTPAYMSPEQAAGESHTVGPASDIYALGSILYEILTGRIPYEAHTTEAMLAMVLESRPEKPSLLKRHIPKPLESICLKSLARRPEERYPTATDLAQDIERWLADEPVSAHADSTWTRLMRWERRHKPLVAGAAALLLTAAVLVIGFVLIHNRLINEEQQRTELNFQDARKAVEQMLAKVGEERLADVSGMDPVRRQLLEESLTFFERLASRHGDRTVVQLDVARAHARVGKIRSLLEKTDEAKAAFGEAIRRLELLIAAEPNNDEYRAELALAHHQLAWMIHRKTRQPLDAKAHYLAALAIQQELAARADATAEARRDLARSRHDYGLLLQSANQRDEAETSFREALRLRRDLVHSPGGPFYLWTLAQVFNDLGELQRERKDIQDAENAFREAIALQERALDDLPSDKNHQHQLPDAQIELVAFRNNLGLILTERGDPVRALSEYRKGWELGETLTNRFPDRAEYRLKLARTYLNAGLLHLKKSDVGQAARESLHKALANYQRLVDEGKGGPDCLSEFGLALNNLARAAYVGNDAAQCGALLQRALKPQRLAWQSNRENPVYQQRLRDIYEGLIWVQLDRQELAAAEATIQAMLADLPSGTRCWLKAGIYLARCADLTKDDPKQSAEYETRALTALKQAVANGLTDRQELGIKELSSLSRREEFQNLLKSMSSAVPPASR